MAQRNPRGTKPPSQTETARAHGVLLEEIKSQMGVILEAVNGSERRLDAKFDASEARLSDRISVLEEVVRKHSTDIRALRDEVAGLRHDFDHRQELGRIGVLESRVSAIESRLAVSSR